MVSFEYNSENYGGSREIITPCTNRDDGVIKITQIPLKIDQGGTTFLTMVIHFN